MKKGSSLVINVDGMRPDFKQEYTSEPENFPAGLIFDHAKWQEVATYMKIVRPEENKSLLNQEGMYSMSEGFNMSILAKYIDEEHTQGLLEKIPHSDQFLKFIV